MTQKQALTAARKRWGKTAMVKQRKEPLMHKGHIVSQTHSVGHVELGMFFAVKGEGPNWQAAIDDADRKERADKARWAALAAGAIDDGRHLD